MKKTRTLAITAALCAALVLCLAPLADAKRIGGGRSFGSSPSMQRSFTPTPQQAPQMNRQQPGTTQQTPGMAQQTQPRRSFGMGGFLGGMLAGGLLGSLLFGGGFGGMPGIMDMLLLALVAYGIFKFISMRRRASQPQSAAAGFGAHSTYDAQPSGSHGQGWDSLRATPAGGAAPATPSGPIVPAGFDVEDFVRGAKMAFTRLQTSWDRRDLADIAMFTTPAVLAEIKAQVEADPVPSKTELLLVNANLLSVTDEDGQQIATVFFDVLLREDPKQDAPTNVREVWHFVRPAKPDSKEMWRLDGIQQVEQ